MSNTDAFLEHFGVKGMKWGVRRGKVGGVINAVDEDMHGKSSKERLLTTALAVVSYDDYANFAVAGAAGGATGRGAAALRDKHASKKMSEIEKKTSSR